MIARTAVTALLANASWVKCLTAAERQRIEHDVTARMFKPGEYVCRRGTKAEHWFGVAEGLVKMVGGIAEGKETTFLGMTSGAWFGEGSLLKDELRRYDVVALRSTVIACVPRATFLAICDANIQFNRFLLHQLNERLGQFVTTVASERLLDPNRRVAHSLAMLYHPLLYPNSAPALDMSQEEIAHLAGLSRQRVNTALRVLADEGLVRLEHLRVTITNLKGLRDYVERA